MDYIIILSIMAVAGLVQGLAGFGLSLIAVPLLTFVIDVKQAVPLCVLMGLVSQIILAIRLKGHFAWRKLRFLYFGLLPGVVAGSIFLKNMSDNVIKAVLGVFLLIYAMYSLFRRRETKGRRLHPLWASAAGFLGGAISASVSGGGPPVVVYTSLSGRSKDEIKAMLAAFFIGMTGLTSVAHVLSGLTTADVLKLFSLSLPAVIAGLALGLLGYGRLKGDGYKRLLCLLLAALGVMLLVKSV